MPSTDKFKENRDRTEKICYNSVYGLQEHKKGTPETGIPLPCLPSAKSAARRPVAGIGYTDALGLTSALGVVAAFLSVTLNGGRAGGAASGTVGGGCTLAFLIRSTIGAGAHVDALQATAAHLIMRTGGYFTFQICH